MPTPPLHDDTAMIFLTPDRPEGPSGPKLTVAGTVLSPAVSRAERAVEEAADTCDEGAARAAAADITLCAGANASAVGADKIDELNSRAAPTNAERAGEPMPNILMLLLGTA